MAWPEDLTQLMKRISTPAEEVFEGLEVLGDYLNAQLGGREVGGVYWVDGVGGSNSNSGLTAAAPFLTIKYALAQCDDNNNDHILVTDYYQPQGEDWPIVVDKHQVHIVGVAQPNFPYPAIVPSGTTAAFQLTSDGQYGSIQKLTIGGGSVGGGIDIGATGQVDGFLIKNCVFGHKWFGTPVSGIQQLVTSVRGGYGNRIEKCIFLGDQGSMTKGAITGNAIDLLSVYTAATMMYSTQIVDNVFMGCAIGINLARASDSIITGNKFMVADAADGEAVTLSALCLGGMIDDNRAMEGTDGMTYNPFKDLGTNHWGLNYRQGLSVMPVTV